MQLVHPIYVTESNPTAPRMTAGRTIVAAGAATIHAAVQEGAPAGSFTAIVQPDVPRKLSATFAAGWQGGDIFIKGVDADGMYIEETIPDTAGSTINGTQVFRQIYSIEKELVAGTTDTVTIGTQQASYYSSPFRAEGNGGESGAFRWKYVGTGASAVAASFDGYSSAVQATGTPTGTFTLWRAAVHNPRVGDDTDWASVTASSVSNPAGAPSSFVQAIVP